MWFKINYASERTVRWQSQCLVEILADTAWLELTNTSPPAFSQRAKRFGADCWIFFLEHSHSEICGTSLNDVSHRDFRRSDGRITKMVSNCQTWKVGGSAFTGCSVNFQIPNVWNPAAVQTNHSFGLGVINHTSHDVTPPYDMRWGRTCQALDKSSMRPIIRRIQTWSKDTPANLWCATT